MYHSDKGDVMGLHPYRYVLVEDGERRNLTFYAETRAKADSHARAWAKPKGKIYRRKRATRKSS